MREREREKQSQRNWAACTGETLVRMVRDDVSNGANVAPLRGNPMSPLIFPSSSQPLKSPLTVNFSLIPISQRYWQSVFLLHEAHEWYAALFWIYRWCAVWRLNCSVNIITFQLPCYTVTLNPLYLCLYQCRKVTIFFSWSREEVF